MRLQLSSLGQCCGLATQMVCTENKLTAPYPHSAPSCPCPVVRRQVTWVTGPCVPQGVTWHLWTPVCRPTGAASDAAPTWPQPAQKGPQDEGCCHLQEPTMPKCCWCTCVGANLYDAHVCPHLCMQVYDCVCAWEVCVCLWVNVPVRMYRVAYLRMYIGARACVCISVCHRHVEMQCVHSRVHVCVWRDVCTRVCPSMCSSAGRRVHTCTCVCMSVPLCSHAHL